MLFAELTPEEKIDQIKKHFTALIEEMVADRTAIAKYLDIVEPVITVAKLIPITDQMSSEEKKETEENNRKLTEQVDKLNATAKRVYDEKLKEQEQIAEILAGLKPVEFCMCVPRCIDVASCLNSIVPALEGILDKARDLAAAKIY